MSEDYDAIRRVRQAVDEAWVPFRARGGGIMPDAIAVAVRTALQFRPITNPYEMLTDGQFIYDTVEEVSRPCWAQPMNIVAEIERQTDISLIRLRDVHWRLHDNGRRIKGNFYVESCRPRGGVISVNEGYELDSPLFDYRAMHPHYKHKVVEFWALTTKAIIYGYQRQHWLVEELVDNSTPKRCFTCNRPLGQASIVTFLPVDTDDWKTLCEAADNNQLELRCFCGWKCQPNDRSEKWYLKEAKRKHKQLKKFLRPTHGVSS